jgi:hypothetical protein
MKKRESSLFTPLLASAAAGPVFVLSLAAAQVYSLMPEPVPIDPTALVMILLLLVPATVVGFLISFLPNAIGAHILSAAGEASEAARAPISWIAVGAALGFGLAMMFGAPPDGGPVTFALVFTSAACAGLCRARTRWES